MLVAFGLSIRTRLRRDLATVPADVDVVVLEQSGVEELTWQDFSRTEELLERGYLDARVVLDRVEEQLAETGGTRSATRWWSRTSGRPPADEEKAPRSDAFRVMPAAGPCRMPPASAAGLGLPASARDGPRTSASVRKKCSR